MRKAIKETERRKSNSSSIGEQDFILQEVHLETSRATDQDEEPRQSSAQQEEESEETSQQSHRSRSKTRRHKHTKHSKNTSSDEDKENLHAVASMVKKLLQPLQDNIANLQQACNNKRKRSPSRHTRPRSRERDDRQDVIQPSLTSSRAGDDEDSRQYPDSPPPRRRHSRSPSPRRHHRRAISPPSTIDVSVQDTPKQRGLDFVDEDKNSEREDHDEDQTSLSSQGLAWRTVPTVRHGPLAFMARTMASGDIEVPHNERVRAIAKLTKLPFTLARKAPDQVLFQGLKAQSKFKEEILEIPISEAVKHNASGFMSAMASKASSTGGGASTLPKPPNKSSLWAIQDQHCSSHATPSSTFNTFCYKDILGNNVNTHRENITLTMQNVAGFETSARNSLAGLSYLDTINGATMELLDSIPPTPENSSLLMLMRSFNSMTAGVTKELTAQSSFLLTASTLALRDKYMTYMSNNLKSDKELMAALRYATPFGPALFGGEASKQSERVTDSMTQKQLLALSTRDHASRRGGQSQSQGFRRYRSRSREQNRPRQQFQPPRGRAARPARDASSTRQGGLKVTVPGSARRNPSTPKGRSIKQRF